MKKLLHSWKPKDLLKKEELEMGKEQRHWNAYYKPGQDVYWFQVPKYGSIKFSYDNIVQKNWGRHWYVPALSPKKVQEDQPLQQDPVILEDIKPGSIILFGIPNKIVDVFIITRVYSERIYLSPVFFTMLWRNMNFIPPIPACYKYPRRNHPVKLKNGDKFRDYIEKNKDDIFQEVYSWER